MAAFAVDLISRLRQSLFLKSLSHRCLQLCYVDRLHQEHVRALPGSRPGCLRRAIAGYQDKRHCLVNDFSLSDHVQSIEAIHLQVGNDQIKRAFGQFLDGFTPR